MENLFYETRINALSLNLAFMMIILIFLAEKQDLMKTDAFLCIPIFGNYAVSIQKRKD